MNQPPVRLAIPLLPSARLGSSAWLLHLRSFAVAGQLVTILLAGWGIGVQLPYAPLLGLVALTAVTNLIYGVWLRRYNTPQQQTHRIVGRRAEESPVSESMPPNPARLDSDQELAALEHDGSPQVQKVALGLMLLDLATLTAMLYYSGGAANPFSFFYFVNLAVGGVMIWPKAAWSLTVVATLGYALILRYSVPVKELSSETVSGGFDLRTGGLMLAFGTCASVVTYFVTRTSGLLRARERQLREYQLAKAADRKLESLTTLAAGAAHELATPLSTIDVVARELSRHLEGVDKPVTVDQDLKLIDHQLDLCRHILQRMRGAAGDSMAQEWFRTTVGELIDATLEGVRDPHRVDVVDGTEAVENKTLWMPEEAVAQAIRNLIHNGLDASGAEGRVRVESRLDRRNVEFIVTDQGQGMTDEVLGRVGDPFFTTKEPGRGIGLGLYLTRNVVSQLGGSLSFRSAPGQGTSAVVTLPIAKPENVP
ncbi:Sensor histidine kinase RegB [Stieleria maiorica]|uniref:histidine kinase n=1 Tax=Stieleria maiorica TaxID=2795974 RepID=A0A5B9MG90_9BACT|nr:ATP-binding protein [Stieleria maiorica]QEF99519.1 Sensor histidine kinase RegB [Stieleria maiorica]